MNNETNHLRRRIDHEWQQMTGSETWNLCAALYEERDLKDLLYSRLLDDVETAQEEELEFLLNTIESVRNKKS